MSENARNSDCRLTIPVRKLTAKALTEFVEREHTNPGMMKELYTENIGMENGKVYAKNNCKTGNWKILEKNGKKHVYVVCSPRASKKQKKEKITNDNYDEKLQELQTLEELNKKYQDDKVKRCITESVSILKKEIETYEKKLAKQSSTKKKVDDTFDSTLPGLSSPKQSKTAKLTSTSEMEDGDQTSTMPLNNAKMDTNDIDEISKITAELDDNLSSSEDDSE